MKPPQVVIQPPSPEWTEEKAVNFFNKNQNQRFRECEELQPRVRYEFKAELFRVCDSQRSGNKNCLPHDVTNEIRSRKTLRRSNDLSRKRDSPQQFSKWFGETVHGEMQKRQGNTFLPSVKEPTGRRKEPVGKAASSPLRKGLTKEKAISQSKTAVTDLKHSVSHTKSRARTEQSKIAPCQQKLSGKVSSKPVLFLSNGSLETKRTTSKLQAKATKTITESKQPLKHSKSSTKQASHQTVIKNPAHSKDILSARLKRLSIEDCDLHGSVNVSSTENMLNHSSCNLFPVSIDQLYEEVETLQPPRPFVPHTPSSNEEPSPVSRKSSLTNRSNLGRNIKYL